MDNPQAKRRISPLALVLLLSACFFALFLVISGAIVALKAPSTNPRSGKVAFLGAGFGSGSVGIVEVSGVILDSKKTLKRLEHFEEDNSIKAVVLRLNSPGGAVAPAQEIFEAVRHYKKPIIASMASVAASGAYYIACGANEIFANPGSITGSIGVIMEFANLSKLYDWAKIQRYVIKTGKFKDAGAEHRDMTPEERALMQAMIDDVLVQFKAAVAKGRKLSMSEVNQVADGRIFSGAQALRAKLVDRLGGLQDAINEAASRAKIQGKPNVVYPEGRNKLLEYIWDENRDETSAPGNPFSSLRPLLAALFGGSGGSEETIAFSPGIYWIWTGAR